MTTATRYILALLASVTALPAEAQTSAPATRPAGAPCEQRAADDAFADLMTRLLRLPFDDTHTLREWIGSRVAYDLALRRSTYDERNVQKLPGAARELCQVQVSVPLDAVVRGWVMRLQAETSATDDERRQLAAWAEQLKGRRLSAVGVSDPRTATLGAASPAGWRHLPPEAVELARDAAVLDAADRLLAECRSLRLSATESLATAFDLYPAFEDACRRQLERHATGHGAPAFEPFGVCRVSVTIARADLVAGMHRAANDLPAGQKAPKINFTQLTDSQWREAMTVEGVSIPPPSRLAWPGRSPNTAAPTWADERLTAVGRSEHKDADPDPEAARRATASEALIDAIRSMWLQVDELVMPDRRRVKDVILANPDMVPELAKLEERMQSAAQTEFDGNGRAAVKITMPLAPLWDVLKRATPADGPGGATSRPAR